MTQTPAFLFSFADGKGLDTLTCIFICLKKKKREHSAQGALRRESPEIDFVSFIASPEGFLYGMEGWLTGGVLNGWRQE